MKHPALDSLLTELQSVRDSLDDADRTPFGDFEKLLDKMAAHCDRALDAARSLEDA